MATEENKSRPITAGEREMIEPLYKDSINYGDVNIFNGEYLPFGFQFDDYVMAPNGNIYFPEGLFREDFSSADLIDKAIFVHEMGHVWQHQMGVNVRSRGLFSLASSYEYSLPREKDLADYSLEQQASIIADYYVLTKYGINILLQQSTFKGLIGPDLKDKYENTLRFFLASPSDKRCLWK